MSKITSFFSLGLKYKDEKMKEGLLTLVWVPWLWQLNHQISYFFFRNYFDILFDELQCLHCLDEMFFVKRLLSRQTIILFIMLRVDS